MRYMYLLFISISIFANENDSIPTVGEIQKEEIYIFSASDLCPICTNEVDKFIGTLNKNLSVFLVVKPNNKITIEKINNRDKFKNIQVIIDSNSDLSNKYFNNNDTEIIFYKTKLNILTEVEKKELNSKIKEFILSHE